MNRQQILMIASVMAVILSIVIITRSISARVHFDRSVNEALKTSEGYDQRFIDMVNRLENILAQRAQFGFGGGTDPMTGTKRMVVQTQAAPAPRTGKARPGAPASVAATATADPVKLTAIIADASGKKITAVVMDGERSFSVDPGDYIAKRRITQITNDGIYMESDTMLYFYDIRGNKVVKKK